MSVHRHFWMLAVGCALAAPLAADAQTAPAPAPVTSPAAAGPAAPHHHRESAFFRALDTLTLTPDQQQQIQSIRTQEHAANAGADGDTRQANAAKMRDQIMALLTPEQKTQLETAWHHGHGAKPDATATP